MDVLIPESTSIKIKEKAYTIGELSFKQAFKLSKFLGRTILNSKDKLKKLAGGAETSKNNIDDILNMLNVIDDNDIAELLSILLNEPDAEILDSLSFMKTLEVVEAICKHNKFEQIKKKIASIGSLFETKKKAGQ